MKTIKLTMALALSCSIVACTSVPPTPVTITSKNPPKLVEQKQINDLLQIGKSKKEEVLNQLGPTKTIQFETGYEVWVYTESIKVPNKKAPLTREWVLLFAPDGILSKFRTREDKF